MRPRMDLPERLVAAAAMRLGDHDLSARYGEEWLASLPRDRVQRWTYALSLYVRGANATRRQIRAAGRGRRPLRWWGVEILSLVTVVSPLTFALLNSSTMQYMLGFYQPADSEYIGAATIAVCVMALLWSLRGVVRWAAVCGLLLGAGQACLAQWTDFRWPILVVPLPQTGFAVMGLAAVALTAAALPGRCVWLRRTCSVGMYILVLDLSTWIAFDCIPSDGLGRSLILMGCGSVYPVLGGSLVLVSLLYRATPWVAISGIPLGMAVGYLDPSETVLRPFMASQPITGAAMAGAAIMAGIAVSFNRRMPNVLRLAAAIATWALASASIRLGALDQWVTDLLNWVGYHSGWTSLCSMIESWSFSGSAGSWRGFVNLTVNQLGSHLALSGLSFLALAATVILLVRASTACFVLLQADGSHRSAGRAG